MNFMGKIVEVNSKIYENYQLRLHIEDNKNNLIYEKYYALGYGIFPSSEWDKNSYVQTNYWFLIPKNLLSRESNTILFDLVKLKEGHTYLGLDGLLTAVIKDAEYESAGDTIIIPGPIQ